MLDYRVPWTLKDVLWVYVMRIALGMLLAKFIFIVIFNNAMFWIEIVDRISILLLIWLVLIKYKSKFGRYGLSGKHVIKDVFWGLLGGLILLSISIFSERIYTTTLLLTPTQHPLIVQAEQAATLKDLATPLLLAGVLAPVTEEVLYRMFTFLPLKNRYGLWGGALISAGIFALLHFSIYWLAELIIVGVGLALLYYWSGSLISSVVAHMLINSAKIFFIYYNILLI